MAIEIQAMGDDLYEQPTVDSPEPTDATEQTEPTQEPTEPEQTDGSEVQDGTQPTTEDPDKDESATTPEKDSESEKESTDGDTDESEFYFGDTAVTIDIPDDVRQELDGKGINVDDVVKELYAKDGDFSLKEETYGKLCEAFGKFSVDAYINSLKVQNESYMANMEREAKEAQAADEARYGEVLEMIGGEETWAEIEQYALTSLSDDELAQVNEIMESGNSFAQNLALIDLQNRMKEQNGDKKAELLDATPNVDTDTENSPIDRAEYMRLTSEIAAKFKFEPEKYAQEQAKLDARRRKALQ